ncbi:MAG: type II toxin-antitoxin system RelE/ParE family toxin [Cyclobacteriaceae bacterium]
MKKYKVTWDSYAKESLKSIVQHIKDDSPPAAQKVKIELLKLAQSLNNKPNRFSKEFYLEDKEGNYRSVSKWSYKIIYKVKEDEVYILDVFHTRKDPSEIEDLD